MADVHTKETHSKTGEQLKERIQSLKCLCADFYRTMDCDNHKPVLCYQNTKQ